MTRRPPAWLLGGLALLAVGLLLLLRTVGDDEVLASDAGSPTPTEPAPAAASTAPLQAMPDDPEIETAEAEPERKGAAVEEEDADPEDAIWVEGRVRFPPGTPADERAEVVARTQPSVYARSRRAPVAADGSFRVPFAKGTEKGFLDVAARYAYLPAPLAIAPASRTGDSEPIVLAPELGGCIRGRLVLPANGHGQRASVVGSRVEARAPEVIARIASVDGALGFELGGLPEKQNYRVRAQPEGMTETSLQGVQARAGRVTQVEIDLLLGIRVSGRVVDEKGAPVEGVRFSTRIERAGASWSTGSGDSTGADGRFELDGIPSGKLTLEARGVGFATASLSLGELEEGDVREGLELVLPLGSPVRGRVQWPDGRPAGGCRIEFALAPSAGRSPRPFDDESATIESAADGSFELAGLGEDAITVNARTSAQGTEGPVAVAHVEGVRPGTSGLVLTLEVGKGVRGRAVDDTGTPIAAFEASAVPVDGTQPWNRGEKAIRGLGREGAFAIEGLHDGAWDVTARAKGHIRSAVRRVVLPGDSESFDLVLARSASVSGTVIDPAGAPAQGAQVRSIRSEEEPILGLREEEDAGARDAGRFEIEGLAPGPQKVIASAEGFAESEPVLLDVQPGQSIQDLVLALRRGGRIVGEVLDGAGRPDGNRQVSLDSSSAHVHCSVYTDASGHFEVEALAPGKYRLYAFPTDKELEEGKERGLDSFHLTKQATADVADGEMTHVVLGGAPRAGIRVHGRISSDGRPAGKYGVQVSGADAGNRMPRSCASDEEGRYELVVDGAGTYGITVHGPNGDTGFFDMVEIPAGDEFQHDISLPSGRISGRVIHVDGSSAPGVYVILDPSSETAELSSSASYGGKETDEKGAFAFEGLKAATYRLQARSNREESKPGLCVRPGLVLADGGRIENLEIRLELPARIEGFVTGPDGKALPGATIFVRDEDAPWSYSWPPPMTDGSGRFSVEGLFPGSVTVIAYTKSLVTAENPRLQLRSGETRRVELAVRPGTILRVAVQEAAGKVVGSRIMVTDAGGQEFGGMPGLDDDEDEEAPERPKRIGPIPYGRYRITATNHDLTSVHRDVDVSGDEMDVTLKFGG